MPQLLESLTTTFLQRLDAEEQLLRQALETTAELYEALRRGNIAAVKAAQPRQEQLAAGLSETATRREAAANDLGIALGLAPKGLTLAAIADKLEDETAGRVRSTRDRLIRITQQLQDFQLKNANLIRHLRSYFRSVLCALTKAGDVPVRYGATGARLNPAYGAAIKARG